MRCSVDGKDVDADVLVSAVKLAAPEPSPEPAKRTVSGGKKPVAGAKPAAGAPVKPAAVAGKPAPKPAAQTAKPAAPTGKPAGKALAAIAQRAPGAVSLEFPSSALAGAWPPSAPATVRFVP